MCVMLCACRVSNSAEVKLYKDTVERLKADAARLKDSTSARMSAMQDELWKLGTYSTAMTELVDGLRHGRLPVVQSTSGEHAFYIPPSVLPSNPLAGKGTMPETTDVMKARAGDPAAPRSAVAAVRRLREAFPVVPPSSPVRAAGGAGAGRGGGGGGSDVPEHVIEGVRKALRDEVRDEGEAHPTPLVLRHRPTPLMCVSMSVSVSVFGAVCSVAGADGALHSRLHPAIGTGKGALPETTAG